MIIFFDIETAPKHKYEDLPSGMKDIWQERYCKEMPSTETPESHYYNKAWLYAEYSRVLCISCGVYNKNMEIVIKSFSQDDEKDLLVDFFEVINKPYAKLGWFNIKWFDMWFVCKRALINWIIEMPNCINHTGKKPRDIRSIDIMELWKFWWTLGASLGLVAEALGLPNPKWDIQGNMLWKYYHSKDYDINKVVKYCEDDVKTTMEVYNKLSKVEDRQFKS